MGTYLNSITPYTLYKSECLSAYFVDKTLMLRELFPYVSAGNRHICITRPRQIRTDLKKEKEKSFEDTQTYLAVQKLYQNKTKKEPIYATMPQVVISGPKLSRDYNTNWFASRVNGRYETCMQRAKRIKL
jgi:hypothetical protein